MGGNILSQKVLAQLAGVDIAYKWKENGNDERKRIHM